MPLITVMFPGQGEQRPGMLHDLPPEGRDVLREADDVLGLDALTLDTAEALFGTHATQLALVIAGVAWFRAAAHQGLNPDYFAGHSVGLWSAAVCDGAIELADALALVDVRAQAMAEVTPPGAGMLVSLGLPPNIVEAEAAEVREQGEQVWASNVNSPSQVTISGTVGGLDAVTERLRQRGARKIVRLPVAVPAHCPLMSPAARMLADRMEAVDVRRPHLPIGGNLTGQTLFTAQALRRDLVDSVDHGVQWSTTVAILAERGVDRWLQIPPGHTLVGLVREQSDERAVAMEDVGVSESVARMSR